MAFSEARRFQPEVRQDWKHYNITAVRLPDPDISAPEANDARLQMEVAIWYKFSQHRDLKEELLATGDAELIEVCCYRTLSSHFHNIHIENPELRQGCILGLGRRWERQERTWQGACEVEDETSRMKSIYHVPLSRVLAIVASCVRMYLFYPRPCVVPDSGIRVLYPSTRS